MAMASLPPLPPTHKPFHNSIILSSRPLFLLPKASTRLSFLSKASLEQEPEPKSEVQPALSSEDDPFESRLARVKYRSGTGKKAEIRKTKKGKESYGASTSSSSTNKGVFLPPVALKEPVSGGLKVDFGFSPYSERVNGRLAGLGLAALLLVELGTGKSVINYHTPATVFLQLYFMAGVCALYLKYEKEKVSVWPQSDK